MDFRSASRRGIQLIRVLATREGISKEAAVRALGDQHRKFVVVTWTEHRDDSRKD